MRYKLILKNLEGKKIETHYLFRNHNYLKPLTTFVREHYPEELHPDQTFDVVLTNDTTAELLKTVDNLSIKFLIENDIEKIDFLKLHEEEKEKFENHYFGETLNDLVLSEVFESMRLVRFLLESDATKTVSLKNPILNENYKLHFIFE